MAIHTRYRVNGPRVIQEGFDSEIIVVNLDSGRYYCLQDTGAEVWTLLTQGQSEGDVVDWLNARYEVDAGTVVMAVEAICRELCAESLIVIAEDALTVAPVPADPIEPKRPFSAPALQVFTDMQDLLLLDPIHEVDSAGWPMARGEDTNQPR